MKRVLLVLALPILLSVSSSALAQSGAQCAAIDTDSERLACYDQVFRTGAVTPGELSVTINSEQLIPAHPSGRAPATVVVSCEANGLQVAFGFAGNRLSSLGNDIGVTLQYDLQRRANTLTVNDQNTAALLDDPREAQAFLDNLAGVDNLTVRVTPVSIRTLSPRFPAQQIRTAAEPVVEACG